MGPEFELQHLTPALPKYQSELIDELEEFRRTKPLCEILRRRIFTPSECDNIRRMIFKYGIPRKEASL